MTPKSLSLIGSALAQS